MKTTRAFCAGIALALFTAFTAIAAADDDDLDVTMEVLDSVADLDGQVLETAGSSMEGDAALPDAGVGRDEEGAGDASGRDSAIEMTEEFERHDAYISGDDDDSFGDESKFEDDEHVDMDVADALEEPEVEPEPSGI